jgi:hypothetical protein
VGDLDTRRFAAHSILSRSRINARFARIDPGVGDLDTRRFAAHSILSRSRINARFARIDPARLKTQRSMPRRCLRDDRALS